MTGRLPKPHASITLKKRLLTISQPSSNLLNEPAPSKPLVTSPPKCYQNVTHCPSIYATIKSGFKRGIKMTEFGTGVIDGKLPINLRRKGVASLKPSHNGLAE